MECINIGDRSTVTESSYYTPSLVHDIKNHTYILKNLGNEFSDN